MLECSPFSAETPAEESGHAGAGFGESEAGWISQLRVFQLGVTFILCATAVLAVVWIAGEGRETTGIS
jgi:hypothetical protein